MPTLKTNLEIIFVVGTILSLVDGIASLLTVLSYWRTEHEPDQRKRKVMSSSALSSVMLFLYYLSGLVVIATNDKVLTAPIMESWAFTMWFFLLVGAGAVGFALSKFFRLVDNCTWVVTISTALGFGLLGAADIFSTTPAFHNIRWVFFAVSCVALLVALVILVLSDRLHVDGSKDNVAEKASPCEAGFRTVIRIWLILTWMLVPIAWLLGVYGVKGLATSNHTFEQASYLVVLTLALIAPLFLILVFFNPDTAMFTRAASKAGNVINRASHNAMGSVSNRGGSLTVISSTDARTK